MSNNKDGTYAEFKASFEQGWGRIKHKQIKNLKPFATQSNRERCDLLALGGDRGFQRQGRKDLWLRVTSGMRKHRA